MGMIVSIDEARYQQPAAGINDLVLLAGCQVGADRNDDAILDEHVGHGRLMDVTFVIVNLAAANEKVFR